MATNANEAGITSARTGAHRAKPATRATSRITVNAVIANGAAISGAIDCGLACLVGVQMSAAWTAADLYLLASADGVTYGPVSDRSGTPYAVAVAADEVVALDRTVTEAFRYLKIGSGTAALPVNQDAARTVKLILA